MVSRPVAGIAPERGPGRIKRISDAIEVDTVDLPVDPHAKLLYESLIASGGQTAFEDRVLDPDTVPLAYMGDAGESSPSSCRGCLDVVGHEDVQGQAGNM